MAVLVVASLVARANMPNRVVAPSASSYSLSSGARVTPTLAPIRVSIPPNWMISRPSGDSKSLSLTGCSITISSFCEQAVMQRAAASIHKFFFMIVVSNWLNISLLSYVPRYGTSGTMLWYSLYQRLVASVPTVGSSCTTLWYFKYQRLVVLVPPVGSWIVLRSYFPIEEPVLIFRLRCRFQCHHRLPMRSALR